LAVTKNRISQLIVLKFVEVYILCQNFKKSLKAGTRFTYPSEIEG